MAAAAAFAGLLLMVGGRTAFAEESGKAFLTNDGKVKAAFLQAQSADSNVVKVVAIDQAPAAGVPVYEIGENVVGYVAGDTFYIAPTTTGMTISVKSMSYMFNQVSNLKAVDLHLLDFSECTSFEKAFYNCYKLTDVNLDGIDTSNVENFDYMFYSCAIPSFDVSFSFESATKAGNMFSYCGKLTELDFSGVRFGDNLKDFSGVFQYCSSLKKVDMTNMDLNNVTSIGSLFYGINEIPEVDLTGTDYSKVTSWSYMFGYCKQETIDLSGWDLSGQKNFSGLFYGCKNLKEIIWGDNVSFDDATSLSNMFYGCTSIEKVDLSVFDGAPVNDVFGMFYNCTSLKSVDFSPLADAPIKSCSKMFYSCTSLESVDLSPMKKIGAEDLSYLFQDCKALKHVDMFYMDDTPRSNESLEGMFSGCSSLEYADLSSLTYDLPDIVKRYAIAHKMFYLCESLKWVKFGPSKGQIQGFTDCFNGCKNLEWIDFGNNYTGNFSYSNTFLDCEKLTRICCSEQTWENINSDYMIKVNKFDPNKVKRHVDEDGDGFCDGCNAICETYAAIQGTSVSVGNEIGLDIYVDLTKVPAVAADEDSYLEFTLPNGKSRKFFTKDTQVKTVTVNDQEVICNVYRLYVPPRYCDDSDIRFRFLLSDDRHGAMLTLDVDYYLRKANQSESLLTATEKKFISALTNYITLVKTYETNANISTGFYDRDDWSYLVSQLPENKAPLSDPHYCGLTLLTDSQMYLRVYYDEEFKGYTGKRDDLYFVQYAVSPNMFDVANPISGQSVNDYVRTVLASPDEDSSTLRLKHLCYAIYQFGQAGKALCEERSK